MRPMNKYQLKATVHTENATNKVLQQGKNGLKEVTYKVKYQNDVEISKTVISEVIVRNPVNKIVQVQKVQTSRAATPRTNASGEKTETTSTPKKSNFLRCLNKFEPISSKFCLSPNESTIPQS